MGGWGSGRPRSRADVTDLPRVRVTDYRRSMGKEHRRAHLEADGTRIDLESVPWFFHGTRWWLRCPLCGHRRRDLYGRRITVRFVRAGDEGAEPAVGRTSYSWGCRVCFRLGYPSQRLSPYHLYQHRQRLLWSELGGSDETFDDSTVWRWPKRPRGMRRATQARLKDEYNRLAEASEWAASRMFERFVARFSRGRA